MKFFSQKADSYHSPNSIHDHLAYKVIASSWISLWIDAAAWKIQAYRLGIIGKGSECIHAEVYFNRVQKVEFGYDLVWAWYFAHELDPVFSISYAGFLHEFEWVVEGHFHDFFRFYPVQVLLDPEEKIHLFKNIGIHCHNVVCSEH